MFILLAYLFGSIPFALVIGKVFYKTDVRNYGSGNLGGSNAGRVLGKKAGVAVTLLDALKGFIAMGLTALFAKESILVAGVAACIGHCFPIFAGFKGGKAVATSFGFLLGVSVLITHQYFFNLILPIGIFFLVLYLCKMVSVSSITALLSAVLLSLIFNHNYQVTLGIFILWVIVTIRHHENIKRVITHTERKVTWI